MTVATEHWSEALVRMEACGAAVEWARGYSSLQSAWDACERADWMLWYLAKVEGMTPRVRLCACDCARTALKFVPAGEDRPRLAIECAERYARGEATVQQLAAAGAAAWAAAGHAAGAAAWAAAWGTAWDAAGDAAPKEMCVLIRKRIPTP